MGTSPAPLSPGPGDDALDLAARIDARFREHSPAPSAERASMRVVRESSFGARVDSRRAQLACHTEEELDGRF